jgi:peptide/nickel transport system substrate-binding protein
MLQEWVRGDHLTFVRNPNYWRKDQPYLDKVVVKIMPDSSARVLALRAGEVDFIDEYYFPLSAYAQFAHDPNYVLQDVSYPSDDLAIINTKQPHLDNPKVRQALLIAIDRDFVHRAVFYGIGSIPQSSVDTRIPWAYNPAVNYEKAYAYDPKRAAALLDSADAKAGPDGTRFTIRLSFDAGRSEYTALAQALQRYWQAVGIKVVLEGAERPVVLKRVYSDYDFDVTLQNYTTSGDPALGIARLYVTSSIKQGSTFNNASRYSNPELDALFDHGQNGLTRADRAKDYFKAQEILARDLPVLNLHQQAEVDAATSKLRDVFLTANYVWWGSVWMAQ